MIRLLDFSTEEFFILSTRNKLWTVMNNGIHNTLVYEFNNPKITNMTLAPPQRTMREMYSLNRRRPVMLGEVAQSVAEVELNICCEPEDFKAIYSSKKDIQPDEFYSMKELEKISKIITRKLKKIEVK